MADHPRSPSYSDFYNVLSISKTTSILDVSKAYKSLIRKWHPDKNPSNASEVEVKFTAINETYKAINGKKRQETRGEEPTTSSEGSSHRNLRRGSADDSLFSQSSFLSKSISRRSHTPTPSRSRPNLSRSFSRGSSAATTNTTNNINTFNSLSKMMSRRSSTAPTEIPSLSKSISRKSAPSTPIIFSQSMVPRKPPPIEKKLACTLEELCIGCVKKIKISRDVIANNGMIKQQEEILKIRVKPGWRKGTKITFEGKGDEKPGTLPADIIFLIDEKRHPLFKKEGDDLVIGVEVPLVQALTGCTISVPLLGGEKMCLSFDDIIYPGYEKAIQGQGMPKSKDKLTRGNLRLKFLINFPTKLSLDQRSCVCDILQDEPSP